MAEEEKETEQEWVYEKAWPRQKLWPKDRSEFMARFEVGEAPEKEGEDGQDERLSS